MDSAFFISSFLFISDEVPSVQSTEMFVNYELTSVLPQGNISGSRSYEDTTIEIEFKGFVGKYPAFKLLNTSTSPLTIVWDLCTFFGEDGRAQRVIGRNTAYEDRGKSIPPTLLIPDTHVEDIFLPVESIERADGGWVIRDSIPKRGGSTVRLALTVESQGKRTTYIFSFESVMEKMVFVEGGQFTMGDNSSDEKRKHEVVLTYDLYMKKYPVTFEEFDAFCSACAIERPEDSGWGRGKRPVINVSWQDAAAYCNWLSKIDGLPEAYDSNGNLLNAEGEITRDLTRVTGYRLPSEAEWEYAAKGGRKSKGYKYAGSNDVDEVAWYYRSHSCSKTKEVARKAANELGLFDMSGNIWEWCSDFYGPYADSEVTNPYNDSGSRRVIRGGSWLNSTEGVRIASRCSDSPDRKRNDLGFRICRTVSR